MRASELLERWCGDGPGRPKWLIPRSLVVEAGGDGDAYMKTQDWYIPPAIPTEEVLACLARIEAAVEALAEDAGSGPARRVRAILDGGDKEGT